MNHKIVTLFAALSIVAGAVIAAPDIHQIELAEAMLTDAAIRADGWALDASLERLDELLEGVGDDPVAARLLYDRGLTGWAKAMTQTADMERAAVTARRMMADLERSAELDPETPATWALISRGHYLLYTLGAGDPAATRTAMEASRAKGRETGADDPLVILEEGIVTYHTPSALGGDEARGLGLIEAAVAALEEGSAPTDRYWFGFAHTVLAQIHLRRGDVVAARAVVDDVLAVLPDLAQVRDTILPMTEPVTAVDGEELAALVWREIAVDPEGDAAAADLPDARRLSWAVADDGRVWLRFDLHNQLDATALGVNIPVDTDHDQTTGAPWWGGNTDFTWDRLVTVWVARANDGSYHGAVGLGDTTGVGAGRYLNLGRAAVAFHVDDDLRAVSVGFDPGRLAADGRLTLLGVVGSNTRWSDVIVDRGSVTIDLSS